MTIMVGGLVRSFILHVPSTASDAAKPLLLVFHGAGDTAVATEGETDLKQVADARSQLVAFMQGYENTWNEGTGLTAAAMAGVDDVAFAAAALAEIRTVVPVDPRRVAAVGFSNGGLLVEYLGCHLTASFALIVPVSGSLLTPIAAACKPARPVSVLAIHGTADDAVPYNGGSLPAIGAGTVVLSATASIAKWAALNGCSAIPASSTQGAERLTAYSGCRSGVTVALHTLVGAGHTWPSDVGEQVAQALGG